MRNWNIAWENGRTETVKAADYREAHRKAHNRVDWIALGRVVKIALAD